ncbi:hypothetical protein B0T10DRAFT_120986 [Thelonectria olida]|uniref:Uncharacterized protein n=1 Tax=Thelonectria olida TaxID=1576542 RepID=A0A9P9AT02_9HYPO|nr:hypothetical protein B0T10DRAFT_120986 [Thelonectria olida]
MDSGAPQNNQQNTTRRRSSGWMPAFASLSEQKRGSEANTVRRQSMSDQQPKGGIFSQFFHNNFGRDATK